MRKPEPTVEEIRQHCREIQGGWDDRTKRDRGAWAVEVEAVEIPRVAAADFAAAAEK